MAPKYFHRVKLKYRIQLLSLQFLALNFKDVYAGRIVPQGAPKNPRVYKEMNKNIGRGRNDLDFIKLDTYSSIGQFPAGVQNPTLRRESLLRCTTFQVHTIFAIQLKWCLMKGHSCDAQIYDLYVKFPKLESFRFEDEDEDEDENKDQVQLLLIVRMLKSVTVMA